MSEGRGLTLRKKRKERPVISGPQPTSTPSTTRPAPQQNKSGSNLAVPRERNAPTETSDLVKRRYSTRYNQLPDFSNIDTPGVPSLPGALKRSSRGGSPRRPNLSISSHPLKVDQDALADPNLQHERYVTDLLSNASEHDIQEYQNSLRRIKHRNSTDLQQNVYQNRTQFIKISKEAEKLKTEMSVLQALMGELTGALSQTQSATTNGSLGSGATSSRRNANRTSVANLENMWNIQLQALWKNVERSQKFLPAIPGRHIIMENGQWIELDSATWKPKRPVHVVLLNDHFLVASKKRKRIDPNVPQQGPAPTKLVAEECWPLLDIDIVDMSATSSTTPSTPSEERAIATAITVRAGGRSLVYRPEKRDERAKNDLLVTFRKAAEDLRKANKVNTDSSSPHTDTLNYFATRDPASAKNMDILESLNSAKDKPDILIEVDGKQQNFRWVESQIDELDIDVALQRFDEAVAKVEKLRSIAKSLRSNSIAQDLILVKVEERALKLSQTLIRELIDTPSFSSATKRTVSHLSRLGFEDQARTAFLSSRSDELVKRSRQCVFEGDLHRYVFSLAFVYFTMIKNTVVIYQSSFAAVTVSAVIKWANEHLEHFNSLLVRQLSSVEKEGNVWRACMDVVWEHERSLLGEVGLDFREVIGRGLEIKDIPFVRPNGFGRTMSGESQGTANGVTNREQSRSKSRARTGPGAWPEQ